jgi:hypothetical protein
MGYSIHHGVAGVGSKPPLRRRVTYNGSNLVQAVVSSASYTVYARRGNDWEAVDDHTAVALAVADTVSDELQEWDTDTTGYNVQVVLSAALASPFAAWGSEYLVAVTLVLSDGVVDGFAWLVRTPE